MKNSKKMITSVIIFASFLALGLISTLAFAPIVKSNATEASADIETVVSPVVAIATDENLLSFDLNPFSGDNSASKPIVVTVGTNSTGGYELYFSSEDDSTAMTSATTSDIITSNFYSAVTLDNMGANRWGYSLNNTSFSKIPTLSGQAKIKNLDHLPTSNEGNTTVNIGIKIGKTLASGVYSKVVKFSAIAHESLVPTPNLNRLTELTSMQDSRLSQYCSNTYTPTKDATELTWDSTFYGDLVPRASVQDSRDGKYYLISKLADGNCWMSQNLEFILDSTKTLTNQTTDLNTKTSWTPEVSTLTEVPNGATWEPSLISDPAAYSYYPIASDRYYKGGTTKSSSPTASGAEYDWEKAGIYYHWYAATAGSGDYAIWDGNVHDSICPKGWRLPFNTGNRSWYNLLTTTYGITNSTASSLLGSPFNFPRAGYYLASAGMYYQESSGGLWSTTSGGRGYAYNFGFSESYLNPKADNNKNNGLSVRCVAR